MTLSFSTMAIFFSRPLTLTINSLDIDFLSVNALDTRSTGALSALKTVERAMRGLLCRRSICAIVDGSCRQNVTAVDLRYRPAIASGDAFEIDQADRDLPRGLEVPSAQADG